MSNATLYLMYYKQHALTFFFFATLGAFIASHVCPNCFKKGSKFNTFNYKLLFGIGLAIWGISGLLSAHFYYHYFKLSESLPHNINIIRSILRAFMLSTPVGIITGKIYGRTSQE